MSQRETYVPENKAPQPTVQETPEQEAQFEYTIEIGCPLALCDELRIDQHFLLGRTESEKMIARFDAIDKGDTTLLVAKVKVQEPKVLHLASRSSPMALSVQNVQVDPLNTHKAREAFIPVHLGLEVGHRLGLPTEGYYYHFKDHQLLHEYKICDGEYAWGFNITRSTAKGLSDELLSEQYFTSLLLPWRVQDQQCDTQHLVHSPTKLSDDQFRRIDAAWLDANAVKLDLNAIIAAQREEKAAPIEPQPDETIYVVKKDDTLSSIAEQHGTTLDELKGLNPEYQQGNRQHRLYPGDEIAVVDAKKEDAPSRKRQHTYTIKKNDTLSKIAQQNDLSLDALLELNPFFTYGTRMHNLFEGDKVIVKSEDIGEATTHTVAAGEGGWYEIAQLYGLTGIELRNLNLSPPFTDEPPPVGSVINVAPYSAKTKAVLRNTLPAKEVRDINRTDNMHYSYRGRILATSVKRISKDDFPEASTIVKVASLRAAMGETIKLCLARHALDEVTRDERPLEEKVADGDPAQVLAGKHPRDEKLCEKYRVAPSRYQEKTPHTMTLRQLREGYVYLYYAPVTGSVAIDYGHACKLYEYQKKGAFLERNGVQTPYLPCQTLPGKAYIVYSERQWTAQQKERFVQDPGYRGQATKTSGQIYSFIAEEGAFHGETSTFNDIAKLMADVDAGEADQNGRFAATTVPTLAGGDTPHLPVMSNQLLLDTIDEEKPMHADIVVLEDPNALVEDTLAITGGRIASWAQWQKKHQDHYKITKAVTDFCNLQLPLQPRDTFLDELNKKDPVTKARILTSVSDNLAKQWALPNAGALAPNAQVANETTNFALTSFLGKEHIHHYSPKHEYISQMEGKEKWRSRVRMEEANACLIKYIEQEWFFKQQLHKVSHAVFGILNTIGPNPAYLFFDLDDSAHASAYIERVDHWQSLLGPALGDDDLKAHFQQLEPDFPLLNVIGSAAYAGVPEFKPFLYQLVRTALNHTPNEAYNKLINQSHSGDQLEQWLSKANEISFQGSQADVSAHIGGWAALYDLLDNDELAQFKFYNDWVKKTVSNIKKHFSMFLSNTAGDAAANATAQLNSICINEFVHNASLKMITGSGQKRQILKMEKLIPQVLISKLSNFDATITPEGKQTQRQNKHQLDIEMKNLADLKNKFKKKQSPKQREKYSNRIKAAEKRIKKINGDLANAVTLFDENQQRVARNLVEEKTLKKINMGGIPVIVGLMVTFQNYLALAEDYNRISRTTTLSDSDRLTLIYRPLWLAESALRLGEVIAEYQRNVQLSMLDEAGAEAFNGLSLNEAIAHSIDTGNKKLARTLKGVKWFGVGANTFLSVAAIVECSQIWQYDLKQARGTVKAVTGAKLVGTGMMGASGLLPLLSMSGAGLIGLGGTVLYSLATAYLNFAKDDDVSDWLKKTSWADEARWEDADPLPDAKALQTLTRLKKKPQVYTQPTLKQADRVDEANVNGFWLMINLPPQLASRRIRVDVLICPDNDNLTKPGEDHAFYHIRDLASHQGEWITGYRPLPSRHPNGHFMTPELSPTPEQDEDPGISLETWHNTQSDNHLLKLWLPRPWGPTGIIGYRTCPAVVLVWYEDDLITENGEITATPKSKAIPHSFHLDLSLKTNLFGDDELKASFKSVDSMTSDQYTTMTAYNKAVALARHASAPRTLYVGYPPQEKN